MTANDFELSFERHSVSTSHKRPLHPPDAHATVVEQALQAGEWIAIDSDVHMALSTKRMKMSNSQASAITNNDRKSKEMADISCSESNINASTGYANKRSLFPSKEARQMARRLSNEHGSTADEHSGLTCDVPNLQDSDEEEALRLVTLISSHAIDVHFTAGSVSDGSRFDPNIDIIAERQAREENEGHQRSRSMREGNLTKLEESWSQCADRRSFGALKRCGAQSSHATRQEDASHQQGSNLPETTCGSEDLSPEIRTEGISSEPIDAKSDDARTDTRRQLEGCAERDQFGYVSLQQNDSPMRLPATAGTGFRSSANIGEHATLRQANSTVRVPAEAGNERLREIEAYMKRRAGPVAQARLIDAPLYSSRLARVTDVSRVPDPHPQADLEDHPSSVSNRGSRVQSSKADPYPLLQNEHSEAALPALVSDFDNAGSSSASTMHQLASSNLTNDTVIYPQQNELEYLTLPRTFKQMAAANKTIIVQHEACKERQRDLNAAMTALESTARLCIMKKLNTKEQDDCRILREFLRRVFGDHLSGKLVRKKVSNIAASMKRRLERLGNHPQDPVEIQEVIRHIIGRQMAETLAQEKARLEDEVGKLSVLRENGQQRNDSGSKSKRKVVSKNSEHQNPYAVPRSPSDGYEHISSGTTFDLLDTADLKALDKSEKRCQARYGLRLHKEAELTAALDRFVSAEDGKAQPAELFESNDQLPRDIDMSEVSEEDAGEEYYAPAVYNATDHEVPLSLLANEPPDSEAAGDVMSQVPMQPHAQKPDDNLSRSMTKRQYQRSIWLTQGIQRPDHDLYARNLEGDILAADEEPDLEERVEFDDLEDLDTGSADAENRICYRYTVKAIFEGVQGRECGEEHVFGHYMASYRANEAVDAVVTDILQSLLCGDVPPSDQSYVKTETSTSDGLKDTQMTFGRDHRAQCRVWVDKDEYSPSSEAYERACVKKACHARSVFMVRWSKTTGPVSKQNQGPISADSRSPVLEAELTTHNHHLSTESRSKPKLLQRDTEETIISECVEAIMQTCINKAAAAQESQEGAVEKIPNTIASGSAAHAHIYHDDLIARTDQHDEDYNSNDDGDDDLFGSDLVEDSSNTTTIGWQADAVTHVPERGVNPKCPGVLSETTTIPLDALTFYTTISMANREASHIFMQWYTYHVKGRESHGQIRREEQHIEDQLRSYGDMTCWEREQAFIISEDEADDNQDASHEGEGEGRAQIRTKEHDSSVKEERFKVWVERRKVFGPAN